uniref:Uncharacterized protein n=1 Tax=Opuntia streptacantha TaxID=393608 RepID=A0A7C8ZVU0_OPUST
MVTILYHLSTILSFLLTRWRRRSSIIKFRLPPALDSFVITRLHPPHSKTRSPTKPFTLFSTHLLILNLNSLQLLINLLPILALFLQNFLPRPRLAKRVGPLWFSSLSGSLTLAVIDGQCSGLQIQPWPWPSPISTTIATLFLLSPPILRVHNSILLFPAPSVRIHNSILLFPAPSVRIHSSLLLPLQPVIRVRARPV